MKLNVAPHKMPALLADDSASMVSQLQ